MLLKHGLQIWCLFWLVKWELSHGSNLVKWAREHPSLTLTLDCSFTVRLISYLRLSNAYDK